MNLVACEVMGSVLRFSPGRGHPENRPHPKGGGRKERYQEGQMGPAEILLTSVCCRSLCDPWNQSLWGAGFVSGRRLGSFGILFGFGDFCTAGYGLNLGRYHTVVYRPRHPDAWPSSVAWFNRIAKNPKGPC